LLASNAVRVPRVAAGRDHVYHLYVIEHEDRDGLRAHLGAAGVQTVINYPTALPFLEAYARFGHQPADFPATFAMQSRILSLPMFAEISEEQIAHVADSIASFA
jgi:dTDP-4-amino-4,6-dideoxygalactose transaminase